MGWFQSLFAVPDRKVPTSVPTPDQARTLVLYKFDTCPYCIRVLRRIQQLGLQGQIELRDTRSERGRRQELQAATGRTQVPCLFVDGQPLFESADIATWLEAYAART